MRRRCVLAGVALFGNVVLAQGVPKIEMPVGFSMINAHPDLALIAGFNPFGGGEFDLNFDSYLRHFGGTDFALFGDSQVSPNANCSISPSLLRSNPGCFSLTNRRPAWVLTSAGA